MSGPWAALGGRKFQRSQGWVFGWLASSSTSGRPASRTRSIMPSKSSEQKARWCTYSPRRSSTLSGQCPGSAGDHSWIETPRGSGFWKVSQRIGVPSVSSRPSPRVICMVWPGESTSRMRVQSASA